jgi:hypothetical protein
MFQRMDSRPIAFNPDAPLGSRRAIIRRNPEVAQEVEMIEAVWGSDPRFSGGQNFRFIRSEEQTFSCSALPFGRVGISDADRR